MKGETLGSIAKKYNMGWKALAAANPGIDPLKLKVGQKLVIPARSVTSVAPAAHGDGGDAAGGSSYTVKSGDTLAKIAKSHGVTVKALKAANNIKLDRISVGQKLRIPGKAPAPETAAPAPAPATPTVVPGLVPTPGAGAPAPEPPPSVGSPTRTP
jgi:LysM repeat protein